MHPIREFNGPYFWLSNFTPATIIYDGITYPTTEHAYQAHKTLNIPSRHECAKIDGPRNAKFWGRRVKIRPDWETVKDQVMLDVVRLKFEIPRLREMLLKTQDVHLEEGNYWGDTYWGVCNGKGKNMLGKILMQVREEIRHANGT